MNERQEAAFWPWFISLGGGCGIVGYFAAHDDHVTAVIAIVVALSALSGYCLMASRLVCGNIGLVAAAISTWMLWLLGRPTWLAWLGTSGTVLGIMITGFSVALATTLALRKLVVRYSSHRPSLESYNRWAGFGLGAAQAVILCVLLFGGLLVIEPIAQQRIVSDVQARDHRIAQVLAAKVIALAGATRDSSIATTIERYDLRRHLAPLKQVADDLRGAGNPLTRARSKSELAVDEQYSAR